MKNGWDLKSFEDCIHPVTYTRKIQRKEFLATGTFPIVSQEAEFVNGYWDDSSDVFEVTTPVVIFGDHTTVLKFIDFDFVLGADGVKILLPRPFLFPKFFFYQLQAATLEHLGYARHYKLLKELGIVVPPLAEQRRIVGILDEAFKGIATAKANAERNLQNARVLFECHLHAVFSKREGWKVGRLADCLELITYGFTNPMPTTESGPFMVTAKNVVGGQVDYEASRHTSQEAFDKLLTDKSRPKAGDVLLTKDGTLGRLAVVEKANLCINQSIALLRPNGRMNPHFMKLLLSSPSFQRRMVGDADGATIKHIYITRVDKMEVVFPPLIEQLRIVASLDSFAKSSQRLILVCQRKLAALDELKKSLLHRAFSGEL